MGHELRTAHKVVDHDQQHERIEHLHVIYLPTLVRLDISQVDNLCFRNHKEGLYLESNMSTQLRDYHNHENVSEDFKERIKCRLSFVPP